MAILWLLVGVATVLMLGWLLAPAARGEGEPADEIVKRRYARGDIDHETYERLLSDLHAH
ncbi:MAG: hypothetical protein ACM31C_20895 [Acidobacteriota bacterium]